MQMAKASRRRVRQVTKAGCKKVFCERVRGVSAAKTERGQLRKALDMLDSGDVLMVTRLARSTRELLNTLATIADRDIYGFAGGPTAYSEPRAAIHDRVLHQIHQQTHHADRPVGHSGQYRERQRKSLLRAATREGM